MYISNASFAYGIKVDLSDLKDDPIRVQFGGVHDTQISFYFSRDEAIDLMSQLEKAIRQTVPAEVVA